MAQSTLQINVINVSQPKFTKTAKGGYNQIEVAYKDAQGKVNGKKLVDFGASATVYKTFANCKGGELITVTSVKNDGDQFWNWTEASFVGAGQSEGGTGESAGSPVRGSGEKSEGQSPRSTAGRVTGSNYETPAERAKRQIYIVRQSSITAALDLIKHNAVVSGGTPIDREAVIEVARSFEAYVFEETAPKAEGDADIPV